MPREIKSSDQFQKLMSTAQEIRVVRSSDEVKLKLRTPKVLYTYKTSSSEADDILKGAKEIEVLELSKPTSEDSKKGKESEAAEKPAAAETPAAQKPRKPKKRKS